MSYIKHRDRVFDRRRNAVKKRSDTNLRKMSSCSDVRAWSLNVEEQRQYFLDNITSKSTNYGKYIPPDVIADILRKQNNSHLRKLSSLKRCSSEDLLKRKSKEKMVKKRSRISVIEEKDKDIKTDDRKPDKETDKSDIELINLRRMVKDLENRLTTMTSLEDENNQLKSLVTTNTTIDNDKNNNDNSQIVSVQNQKNIEENMAVMRHECSKMRSDMEYLQTKNFQLSRKLRKTVSTERMLKNREFVVSMESVNNAILKSKVDGKEMKIRKLMNINEEQKAHIQSLFQKINEINNAFSWKEEMLMGKLVEYKNIVKASSDELVKCHKKLSLSSEVIKEMEILRDHFRQVNTALRDNVLRSKSRLRLVAKKALTMACKIDFLLGEIEKRDARIQQLSKFPGRPSMAVRLTQLENIIEGDFLFEKSKIGVVETFERLKRILKELKKETWDYYGYEHPNSLCESSCQTPYENCDKSIQNSPVTLEIDIQSDHPDEYIKKYIQYILCIEFFNSIVVRLRKTVTIERESNNYLQHQLDEQIAEIKSKSAEIDIINKCNKALQDKIKMLKGQIDNENKNMSIVLKDSRFDISIRDSLFALVEDSAVNLIDLYDNYCNLLENFIENNEDRIDEMMKDIEIEFFDYGFQYCHLVNKLKNKCDYLEKSLEDEVEMNFTLNEEIDYLNIDLHERDCIIDKLKDNWIDCQIENERLYSMLEFEKNSACESCMDRYVEKKDVEVMMDTDMMSSYKDQSIQSEFDWESNRSLESKIETSISNCDKLKKIIKNKSIEENKLKKKLYQVNIKVKRIKINILKLRSKLEISVDCLTKLKDSNFKLTESNNYLNAENIKLSERNSSLKENLVQMKHKIDDEIKKNSEINNNQLVLLSGYQTLQSELMKLKNSNNKILKENTVNTDVIMFEYEISIASKDECIEQLKIRVEKLLDILKDIEEEKKYREENAVGIQTQTDNENELEEKYIAIVKEINKKHDEDMEALKKEHASERETKEVYYRKNLTLLKDTYERDIKRIKKSNADSLRKIQSFHEDEINAIKKSIAAESKKNSEHSEMKFLKEKHKLEMEQLRINYEKMLQEKSEVFVKEKENLQEEMSKYVFEKETHMDQIIKSMESNMKTMKKKCKLHMKKLQRENDYAIEEIRKEYNTKSIDDLRSIDDIRSLDSHDIYCRSDTADKDSLDSESIVRLVCKEDDGMTFRESRTDTSGFEDDLYDSSLADERRYLLKRINELEEQLTDRDKDSSENACDSEKRVWIEKEKCREMRQILNKEVERNQRLRILLNEEKNRADSLALTNQTLLQNIKALQQRNQDKMFDTIEISDSDEIFNTKYEELCESYESSLKSDMPHPVDLNYTIL